MVMFRGYIFPPLHPSGDFVYPKMWLKEEEKKHQKEKDLVFITKAPPTF